MKLSSEVHAVKMNLKFKASLPCAAPGEMVSKASNI